MKKIVPETLVPMDIFTQDFPLRIDLAYAKADNLLFSEIIYRKEARLWLHEDIAKIVRRASKLCFEDHGLKFVLYDGLRTTDAQKRMLETHKVKQNPHWLEGPERLLSPPGAGAHPRGMAIDLSLETAEGQLIDMGTAFDYLAARPGAEFNPAHRDYKNLTDAVKGNREKLDTAMKNAATSLKIPLLLLPQEWWDFRLPQKIYESYAPLSDKDLPVQMRMTGDDIAER